MGNEQSAPVSAPESELQSCLDTQELTFEQRQGAAPSARETAGAAVTLADGERATFLFGGHGDADEDNALWAMKAGAEFCPVLLLCQAGRVH